MNGSSNASETIQAARGHPLLGRLRLPGDKSISHRSLLIGSLGTGTSRVRGLGDGLDVRSTADCLRMLGVEVSTEGEETVVRGRLRGHTLSGNPFAEPSGVLDCGNSGTTMRLLLGLLAGPGGLTVLAGDSSLSARPMRRVTQPLAEMGARIWGRDGGSLAPLAVLGSVLHPAQHEIGVASAQVKSALLLAGLRAQGVTRVVEPAPSRDHTELMLAAAGADARRVDERTVEIGGPAQLSPLDLTVPGDPSSAAFWVAAASAVPDSHVRLEGVSINPTRLGFLAVLGRSGARIAIRPTRTEGGEPVGDIEVRSAELRGFSIGEAEVPSLIDEIPILALLACTATGRSELTGLGELRRKETDRLSCLVTGLRAMGAEVEQLLDGLAVEGPQKLSAPDEPLASQGDHRMAMTWAIAALLASGHVQFDGAESVGVSYPSFFADLSRLASGDRGGAA